MKNVSSNWEWEEVDNKTFEIKRKTSTYYRIFYIDKKTKKEKNVYKFWANCDDDALTMLNNYITDHKSSKKTYYYSTSGYFWSGDNRFDSMKEMHDSHMSKEYSDEDRKYDIKRVKDYISDFKNNKRNKVCNDLNKQIKYINRMLADYQKMVNQYKNTNLKDLATYSEKKIDNVVRLGVTINDLYYNLRDISYLIKTKHNYNESWSIDIHILDDIVYNVKRLKKDKRGIPCDFMDKARSSSKKNLSETEAMNKAVKLWNSELDTLIDHVLKYKYYLDYGIVDPNDKDMIKIEKKLKKTLPYKEGRYKEIDYKVLHEMAQTEWNSIWDWMKTYGQSLWD